MKKIISFIVMLTLVISAISFTLVAEAASENLLENPSFESGQIEPTKASSCKLEISSAHARTGSKSIKIKDRTANYGTFQYDAYEIVNQLGSGIYEFSCWVKVIMPAGASKNTASLYALFTPTWTNNYVHGGGKLQGTNTYPYRSWHGGSKINVGSAWTKLTIRQEIFKYKDLQILSSLQMYISQDATEYNTHKNFEIYVDDCEFKKISSLSENIGNLNLPAPKIPAKNADGSVTHADGKVYVNDPNIVYTGRWNTEYNTIYYSGWQSCVEVKFTGTKTLKSMGKYNGKNIGSEVYVDILDEDGKSIIPAAYPQLNEVGRYVYMTEGTDLTCGKLALDPNKTYTLKIIGRWSYYRAVFQGLYMDAGAKTLPADDVPYIEFIGDSITEGYINETYSSASKTGGVSSLTWTDSYAYRTAAKLGWHASAVARSAIAVIRPGNELMPERYERFSNVDPTMKYDFSKQDLDYIVVNLGTNDNYYIKQSANNKKTYAAEYKKFVQTLLQKHPNATIFLMEPYSNVTRDAGGDEIEKIADELDRVEFISTADWNLHTESTMKDKYLTPEDSIHLLPDGADYAAEKLAAVLKAYHEEGSMNSEGTTQNPTATPDDSNPDVTPDATNVPGATNKPNATNAPDATRVPTYEIPEENSKNLTWLWVSLGVVVAVAAAVAVVIVLKKKKAAAPQEDA